MIWAQQFSVILLDQYAARFLICSSEEAWPQTHTVTAQGESNKASDTGSASAESQPAPKRHPVPYGGDLGWSPKRCQRRGHGGV
ncbi:hypothetical protein DPEC_G00136910 [Dallia pectoralis]|uniref:Uncharacterized protein n=1 Tax=Dallia pectoralis TaxID=75939 RepID=A0ACC2GL86_DALPE|nr:hypothetical protein DPEC_G00136910 [Dallia pectoralis]